jgi:hypothetical protein
MLFVERSGISPNPGGNSLMNYFNRDGHVNSDDIPAMLTTIHVIGCAADEKRLVGIRD